MTRENHYTCLITCVFALFSAVQVAAINTYKMDLMCGKEISLALENVYAGIIRFRYSTYLESNKNCSIIISSTLHASYISFYFDSLKIGPTCEDGYLVAQNGRFLASTTIGGFPDRLCGDNVSLIPGNRYFSWGSNVRFRFIGTGQTQLNAGYDIVFTVFDDRPCKDNYYQCDNGHCILSDLRCSGYDPCGDGSDCKPEGLSGGQIAGIAIGGFIGLLMIIFVAILLFCCRKKSSCRHVSTSDTRSTMTRAEFVNQSEHIGSNSRGDGIVFTYGQFISDLPPPYEQVINEVGSAYPSGSENLFKDLPTYEEATKGDMTIGVNK